MIIYSFKWWIPFSHSIETVGSTSSFTNEVGPSNVFDKITWLNPDTTESNHLKALFTRVGVRTADFRKLSKKLRSRKIIRKAVPIEISDRKSYKIVFFFQTIFFICSFGVFFSIK